MARETAMRRILSLASGVSLFVAAHVACAQTDLERAAARDAANNGRAALDAGKYDKAIDYLSRAEQLVHSPTHLLFLARAQTKLGKLVAAHETYLKITRETLASNAPKAFVSAQDSAEQEQDALDARLPSVTVTLQGTPPSDLSVQMDGTALPAAMIGIPLPVDPGEHVFKATSANATSDPVTVKLAESAKQTVTLKLRVTKSAHAAAAVPVATPAAAPAAAPTTPPLDTTAESVKPASPPAGGPATDTSSEGRGYGLRIAGFVSLGIGAAGLGIGTYYLLQSSSTHDESNKIYQQCIIPGGGKCLDPVKQDQILSKDSDASGQSKIGIAALIGGGVGVVTGVTLLIIDASSGSSSKAAQRSTPHVTPVFGLRSFGLVGTF